LPPSFIISALHQLNEADIHFRNAANKRLHVEICLIRLCYLLEASEQVEKKKLTH
jgi:DNA polymerase-3 subunit gamma/tau